jgi:hypothetical protein
MPVRFLRLCGARQIQSRAEMPLERVKFRLFALLFCAWHASGVACLQELKDWNFDTKRKLAKRTRQDCLWMIHAVFWDGEIVIISYSYMQLTKSCSFDWGS